MGANLQVPSPRYHANELENDNGATITSHMWWENLTHEPTTTPSIGLQLKDMTANFWLTRVWSLTKVGSRLGNRSVSIFWQPRGYLVFHCASANLQPIHRHFHHLAPLHFRGQPFCTRSGRRRPWVNDAKVYYGHHYHTTLCLPALPVQSREPQTRANGESRIESYELCSCGSMQLALVWFCQH